MKKNANKKDNYFHVHLESCHKQIVVLSWQINGQKRSFINKKIMRIFLLNIFDKTNIVKKDNNMKLTSYLVW